MRRVDDSNFITDTKTAVTLGKFDGVHLGHRKLIETVQKKEGLVPTLITFKPHPSFLFAKNDFSFITAPDEKTALISMLGIEFMLEYPFTYEFSQQAPENFARKIIFENLKCKYLVVGENFRFGKEKSGDYEMLAKIAKEYDAEVTQIPKLTYNGEVVSSSLIREKIKSGEQIHVANNMLAAHYQISGRVVTGKKIGRTIGFPTLNIDVPEYKVLPGNGVYVTETIIGKTDMKYIDSVYRYKSITNIGFTPTVSGTKKTIETHVFDFSDEIYGTEITVLFHKFLRNEKKFEGLSQLEEQLMKDKQDGLRYFDDIK